MQGYVTEAHGGFYTVNAGDASFTCRLRGKSKRGELVVVPGDRVEWTQTAPGEGAIEAVLPRKNLMPRPAIANIDQLMIVASVSDPPPDFLMIDRLLIIAYYNHIQPMICFTKCDLIGQSPMGYYRQTDIPIYEVGFSDTAGLSALKDQLAGQTTALAGNSGVGKSTLINRLVHGAEQTVAEVSERLHRGRHTTRHITFFPFMNGYLADTPGFNALHLPTVLEPVELARLYPDYLPQLEGCKYSNCLHVNEPNCAIKAAVANEALAPERYENYQLLLKELVDEKRRLT